MFLYYVPLYNQWNLSILLFTIYCEDTLNKTDYINKLVYHAPSVSNQENKNKNGKNPPCGKNVTTRIGQSFVLLIDTHFPQKTHI